MYSKDLRIVLQHTAIQTAAIQEYQSSIHRNALKIYATTSKYLFHFFGIYQKQPVVQFFSSLKPAVQPGCPRRCFRGRQLRWRRIPAGFCPPRAVRKTCGPAVDPLNWGWPLRTLWDFFLDEFVILVSHAFHWICHLNLILFHFFWSAEKLCRPNLLFLECVCQVNKTDQGDRHYQDWPAPSSSCPLRPSTQKPSPTSFQPAMSSTSQPEEKLAHNLST